jgi:hypothetical protein
VLDCHRLAACLLFYSCAACAGNAVRLPKGAVMSSTSAAEFAGPWRDAQKLRELSAKADAQVAVLPEETFAEILKDRLTETKTGELKQAGTVSFLVALGFAEPGIDLDKTLESVIGEQVVGFYDPKAKVLFVKRGPSLQEQRATLIHELGHALQDQNFGFPDDAQIHSDDQSLAAKALFEGDAMLVMVADALEAAKAKNPDHAVPLTVGAERMRLFFASQPPSAIFDLTGQNKAAADAPLLVREVLLFPYTAGFELVAALYRSGGFVALNEAYQKLPVSNEQVMHPEKYIAGEQPVHIDAPGAPKGTKLIDQDILGELGMRALLMQCLPFYPAQQAAKGWGGDVLSLAIGANQRLAVGSASTWDSEADAIEFEAAMKKVIACWQKSERGKAQDGPWIDNSAYVVRRGSDVAFVRGLSEDVAKEELARLLDLPRKKKPAAPPLGKLTLVPPPPLPETMVTKGTVTGDVFEHPRFALTSQIPQGFTPNTSVSGIDLMIRTDLGATGIFTAAHTPFSEASTGEFFQNVALAFSAQLGGEVKIETLRAGHFTLLDREGEERVLSVVGTPIQIRVVVIPTCDKQWIYGFVLSALAPSDVSALDEWLKSHKESGPPPACTEQ